MGSGFRSSSVIPVYSFVSSFHWLPKINGWYQMMPAINAATVATKMCMRSVVIPMRIIFYNNCACSVCQNLFYEKYSFYHVESLSDCLQHICSRRKLICRDADFFIQCRMICFFKNDLAVETC